LPLPAHGKRSFKNSRLCQSGSSERSIYRPPLSRWAAAASSSHGDEDRSRRSPSHSGCQPHPNSHQRFIHLGHRVTPKNFNYCSIKFCLATNACLRILKALFNFYRHLINFS
jgi:hypothetical protein